MKKFLLLSIGLFLSVNAMAQMPTGAFPSVSDLEGETVGAEALPFNVPAPSKAASQRVPQKTDIAQPTQQPSLFPELGPSEAEKKQQLGNGLIQLLPDDVVIVNPPMGGISFCQGTLKIENGLNVPIRSLDMTLTYGDLNVPISYGNISALGGTGSADLAWAGKNCNEMVKVPQIQVNSCVAGQMTKDGCAAKIQYVPFR